MERSQGTAKQSGEPWICDSPEELQRRLEEMDHVRHLEELIERLDHRIVEVMDPFEPAVERLVTIPGINRRATEVILAEIGAEMSRFPSAGHLSSWAGMCSGNHQSAGKRQSGRTTQGNRWLRQVLVQVAWAASHTPQTFLSATYHRWVKRLGEKRAVVALGHKILVLIYELLKDRTTYQERLVPDQAA
jgi:transposase